MSKPYRLDEYDVAISENEQHEIDYIWPFRSRNQTGKEFDLTHLSGRILDYFGISGQKLDSKPNHLGGLLQQLRSQYDIESIPLTGKNLHLTGDNGLLLVGYEDGVRLIKPQWFGGYEKLDDQYSYAVILIRCLPEQPVGVFTLFTRIFHRRWNQLLVITCVAILAVLVGSIPTFLQEYIFNDVVPNGSRFLMIQIGSLILCLRLCQRTFYLFNSLVGTRLELSLGYYLSAILIQKILLLERGFYEDHGIGDLRQRLGSAHAFRRALENSVVSFITSIIVVICNLTLVYFRTFSISLCLICFALTLIVPVVDAVSAVIETVLRLKRLNVAGVVDDAILNPLKSIRILRGLSAEEFYFRDYAESRKKLARLDIWIGINQSLARVITLIIGSSIIGLLLYWFATPSSLKGLGVESAASTSQGFIIMLLSAFSTVNGATQSFSNSLLSLLKSVPDAIRVRPIFMAQSSLLAKHSILKSEIKTFSIEKLFNDQERFISNSRNIKFSLSQSDYIFLHSSKIAECKTMHDQFCQLIFEPLGYRFQSQISINNSRKTFDEQLSEYRQCFISLDVNAPWISGTLIESLTGQRMIYDYDWFYECLAAAGLDYTDDQLKHRYDLSTSERISLSQEEKSKIALARAFFLDYDFIIVFQMFDLLGRDSLELAIKHIQTHKKMMAIFTSDSGLIDGQPKVICND